MLKVPTLGVQWGGSVIRGKDITPIGFWRLYRSTNCFWRYLSQLSVNQDLEVSVRTVERDIDRLRDLSWHQFSTIAPQRLLLRRTIRTAPVRLGDGEVIAVPRPELLAQCKGTPFENS